MINGLDRISATFEMLREEGRAALMPYYTLGYPTPTRSLEVIASIASAGADLIELGVPFSDPLADGPTIQRSTQIALEQGMTVARCLDLVQQVRSAGVRQPVLLMGYINPILSYGIERYVTNAVGAGVDGFIIPDLPMEEAETMEGICRLHDCALVYLASPASTPDRLIALAQRTTGFLYLISLNGVTGARDSLPVDLAEFVSRVKAVANTPLAVGFGISTPAQAAMVARLVDGVIIGSALINAVAGSGDPAGAAGNYLRGIRAALEAADRTERVR